jgi:hypothetical protein
MLAATNDGEDEREKNRKSIKPKIFGRDASGRENIAKAMFNHDDIQL